MPLGQGIVNPDFARVLRQSAFAGPISLHVEYFDHRNIQDVTPVLQAIQRDFTTLKSWLTAG